MPQKFLFQRVLAQSFATRIPQLFIADEPEPFVHSSSFRSQFIQSADRKLSCDHVTRVILIFCAKHSQHVGIRENTIRVYS